MNQDPPRSNAESPFSEQHNLIAPLAKLTSRPSGGPMPSPNNDTTVSALARHLGVDWHTRGDVVEVEATRRLAEPEKMRGVSVLGVDEHIWRPSKIGDPVRAVTGMVDLTRDQRATCTPGCLMSSRAVPGSPTPAGSRTNRPSSSTASNRPPSTGSVLSTGYANALRDELPDSVAVLDGFHVVKLGTQVVDEVRRRVQQDTCTAVATRGTRCTSSTACSDEDENTCRTSDRQAQHEPAGRRSGLGGHPPPGTATNSCARCT